VREEEARVNSRQMLNLRQAAEHVHMDANELKHVAQRGEIAFDIHGGDYWFEHRALDEWAQRNLLASTAREQVRQHKLMAEEDRRANRSDWRLWSLFREEGVLLGVPGKAKAGILRDMTDLADATGLVYDPDALFKELVAREEIASTAVGEGAAFLHPRFHDPYIFQDTFVAYGRSERPVFFGATDGQGTHHFFLVCSTDHEMHLHILARLAVMAHSTDFLARLDEAETAADAIEAIRGAEEEMLA
jgi:mannitol/fructose-specific phosphotransferase system IIA component (Ntr-type)